jgi:hypothetical protein
MANVPFILLNCGEQTRSLILSGDARLTRQQVARLAQMPPQEQKRLAQQFHSTGRLPKVSRPAKATLSLAHEPAILARTLLDQLGPGQTALLYHELAALLRGQPAGETKRKMPA